MEKGIKDLDSLFTYVRDNENNIYKRIFQAYGLPKAKTKSLPQKERDLLFFSVALNISIEDKLKELVDKYDGDNSKIFEAVKEDFEFNSRIGFYEVLSNKNGANIHVVDLKTSIFETLRSKKKAKLKNGDIIFALSYLDRDFNEVILYDSYIVASKEEAEIIEGIYEDYLVDDDIDVFFDNIVIPRLMKSRMEQIDHLLSRHTLSLMENYDQISIYNFFKHFSDTVKYSLFVDEEVNIYNLDYFDFLTMEAEDGNFVIEGDLESFIDILEFVMEREVKNDPSKSGVLESINECKIKILILKNHLIKNYPQTPLDLVINLSDRDILEDSDALGFLTMGLYLDGLANLDNPTLTKKTRRLDAKTVRALLDEYPMMAMNFEKSEEEIAKDLIQLTTSIMLTNGLAGIKEDDSIYLTARYGYFIMSPPNEVVANFLTALFRRQTLEHYIGRKSVDYSNLLKNMEDFLINLDSGRLEKTKEGKKILEIFQLLGLVKIKIVRGKEYYQLTEIGEIYSDYKKSKNQKGKVLQLK